MINVDESKCVACGRCVSFCPRDAIKAWGYTQIDSNKCTDCFGGVYYFEENTPLVNRERILDRSKTTWTRLCVENCPVDALSVNEE